MLVDARLATEADAGVLEVRRGGLWERNVADASIPGLAVEGLRERRAN